MEDRMLYRLPSRETAPQKRGYPALRRETAIQSRARAAKPNRKPKVSLEQQISLFRRIEEVRDRIAGVMLRYPKLTAGIIPPPTEEVRLSLFEKTAQWAVSLEDLLLKECAGQGSSGGSGSLSPAWRELFRIHGIGDEEMERFAEALRDHAEGLLAVETRFEAQANECGLPPQAASRVKERDLSVEVLSPLQREVLEPLIDELGRIERGIGVSAKQVKEDSAAVLRARADLHSAKKAAVEANLPLVMLIARKYFHPDVPFEDLVQEGNLGLMRAVDKFDYRLGYKFSTYANWWIKQAIVRAIYSQGHVIRLPFHLIQKAGKAGRISSLKRMQTGASPGTEEVARDMGISHRKLLDALQTLKNRLVSMDAPFLEGNTRLLDFIPDPAELSPEEVVINEDMNTELRGLLDFLDAREKRILTKRFGIAGEEEHSLRALGREFGVSQERIRQIEKKALQKMRRRLDALESHRAFARVSKASN